MEPLTSANRITYLYFCTLGGLLHPRTAKPEHVDGRQEYAKPALLVYLGL